MNKLRKFIKITICMVIIIIFGCLIYSHYKTFFRKVYIHSLSEKYGNETGDSSSIRQINEIADFLLDNMKSHYGITESDYLFLLKYYSAWTGSTKNVIELMDSIESQDGRRPKQSCGIIEDKNIIDYDSLWHYALDLYKLHNSSPLCSMIDNEHFLEFVVPYRVDIEPLNLNWRDDENGFLKEFKKSIIIYPTDRILDIANMIMNKWNETPFKWTEGLPHWGSIGEKLLTIKGGNCKDFGIGASYLMRYLGIPAGIDMCMQEKGKIQLIIGLSLLMNMETHILPPKTRLIGVPALRWIFRPQKYIDILFPNITYLM